MDELIRKYAQKLVARGLCHDGEPLLGAMDADLVWNRRDPDITILEGLFRELSISSILLSRPREPWAGIIDHLCHGAEGAIYPEDTETRTFLHDLPVAGGFSVSHLGPLLSMRKSAIVPGRGIVTTGTVTPEQAFVTFSSVCFACFVTFFSDMLYKKRTGTLKESDRKAYEKAAAMIMTASDSAGAAGLERGPFTDENAPYRVMEEAGRLVVSCDLVDSFFGNLSLRQGELLYISQTGSSLDELRGCIDACPLDGSSTAALTASSELSLHLDIVRTTDMKAILHGHPRFSVIISMDCDIRDCTVRGDCHRRCPSKRIFKGVPIVPGEVGRGPFGLHRTVPAALKTAGAALVYGHGTFTAGKDDFNEAFDRMLLIEEASRKEYFRRMEG